MNVLTQSLPSPSFENGTSPAVLVRETSNSSSSSKKCVQFQLSESNQPIFTGENHEKLIDVLTQTVSEIIPQKVFGAISRNSPFRPGGRGSKMLAKAIEQSGHNISNELPGSDPQWVLFNGKTPCFAKVMSLPSPDSSSVFIQPMHPSVADPALLVPWDGHLWLAKSNKLNQVKMKQEPGGWRVMDDPKLRSLIQHLGHKTSFAYPISWMVAQQIGREDWDLVSLESSEFDETGSADSGNLFPMLGNSIASLTALEDHAAATVLSNIKGIAEKSSPQAALKPVPPQQQSQPPRRLHTGTAPPLAGRPLLTTPSPLLPMVDPSKSAKSSPTFTLPQSTTLKSWASPSVSVSSSVASKTGSRSDSNQAHRRQPLESSNNSPHYLCLSSDEAEHYSPDIATASKRPPPVTAGTVDTPDTASDGKGSSGELTDLQDDASPSSSSVMTYEQEVSDYTGSPDDVIPESLPDSSIATARKPLRALLPLSYSSEKGANRLLQDDLLERSTASNSLLSVESLAHGLVLGEKSQAGGSLSSLRTPKADDEAAQHIVRNWEVYSQSTYPWPLLWQRLSRMGWELLATKGCKLLSSVFVPVWALGTFQALGRNPDYLKRNVHYFVEQEDIKAYISKHGVTAITGGATPPPVAARRTRVPAPTTAAEAATTTLATPHHDIAKEGKDQGVALSTPKDAAEAVEHIVNNWASYCKTTYPWALLWARLSELGWIQTTTPLLPTLYVPSWAVGRFEIAHRKLDTLVMNRDYFTKATAVKNYLVKYGLRETVADATPEEHSRRGRGAKMELEVGVHGSQNVVTINGVSSPAPIRLDVSNTPRGDEESQDVAAIAISIATPEDDSAAAEHIVRNWHAYAAATYPWPLLWERLQRLGWEAREVVDSCGAKAIFITGWGIEKFEANGSDLDKLELRCDYFMDKDSIKTYICNFGVNAFLPLASSSLPNNDDVTISNPEHEADDGCQFSEQSPSVALEAIERNTPVCDKEAVLHIVHNWDAISRETYPWPLLWERLSNLGWRAVTTKGYLAASQVLLPAWTAEHVNAVELNPSQLTKNRDFFEDYSAVKSYILKYGVAETTEPDTDVDVPTRRRASANASFEAAPTISKSSRRRKQSPVDSLVTVKRATVRDIRKIVNEIEDEAITPRRSPSTRNSASEMASSSVRTSEPVGILCSLQNFSGEEVADAPASVRQSSRSARVKHFKRDEVFGTWPSRLQSASNGSWRNV